jgi:tetratricopeptide (TPR) repeat protein
MRQGRKRLLSLTLLLVASSPVWGQRARRVRITWLEDVQQAIKRGRRTDTPILLFLRDTFGQGYIDYVERRHDWGRESLRQQLRRSGARWRWQRFEEDILTLPEVAKAVAPFSRVRLDIGYRRMDEERQTLLLRLGLLTDIDLAWRWGLVADPWERSYSSVGLFDRRLKASLSELMMRELTFLVVVAGDGQVLAGFPSDRFAPDPPARLLATHIGEVLEPYRVLAQARRQLAQGRTAEGVSVLRELLKLDEKLPTEIRKTATDELDSLVARARKETEEVEEAMARADYARAWTLLAGLKEQRLQSVDPALEQRLSHVEQQVVAHTQELWQTAQERLAQGQVARAFLTLSTLTQRFQGTEAGSLAQAKAEELAREPGFAERMRRARRQTEAEGLWNTATSAEAAEDLATAYEAHRELADNYADLPQGAEAQKKVAAWEADPELMTRIRQEQARQQAAAWMNLGDNFFVNSLYDEAITYYQKVIDTYPETDVATVAQAKLEETRRQLALSREKQAPGQSRPSTPDEEAHHPDDTPTEQQP